MSDRLSSDLASLRIDRRTQGGPSKQGRGSGHTWRIVGGVAVAAVAVAGIVFLNGRLPKVSAKPEVELSQIALTSPMQGGVEMSGSGYVIPQHTVKIMRTSGRIERVTVQEGAIVHLNDELFVLDAASKTSLLETADAKVVTARAKLGTARAQSGEIHQQLTRQKQLLASGAVAPATVEDLSARARVLDANVGAADAEWKAAQTDRKTTEIELKDMVIRSPMNGRAVSHPASVGDLVSPEKVLVELVDFSSMMVEVDVPEGKLEQVRPGTPAEIILDAYPSKRIRGEVASVNPRINRAKATGTVKVKFVEEAQLALPEMAARVSFLKQVLTPAEMSAPPKKVIPTDAVVDRGGQKIAFTVDDGKARRVNLKVGGQDASGYELIDGPPLGARVIRSPPSSLEDGQSVKVKDSP